MSKVKLNDQLSSFKTGFARTLHKVKVKTGQIGETKNEYYNQEAKKITDIFQKYQMVAVLLERYLTQLKVLAVEHRNLTHGITELCDATGLTDNLPVLQFRDLTTHMEEHRIALEANIRSFMVNPITDYCSQFSDLQARMKELEKRRLDKDRLFHDYNQLLENPKSEKPKLEKAFQKYEKGNGDYEVLLNELMTDMPKLVSDQVAFLNPVMGAYLKAMAIYLRSSSVAAQTASEMVSNLNENEVIQHKKVITPRKQSSCQVPEQQSTWRPTFLKPVFAPGTQTSNGDLLRTKSVEISPGPSRVEPAPEEYNPFVNDDRPDFGPQAQTPSLIVETDTDTVEIPLTQSSRKQAVAIFDFLATDEDELEFRKDDILSVLSESDSGWWTCELRGSIGMCPANYLKYL